MIKGARNILFTASKIDLLDNVSDLNCQAILSFRTSDTNILGLSVNISFIIRLNLNVSCMVVIDTKLTMFTLNSKKRLALNTLFLFKGKLHVKVMT